MIDRIELVQNDTGPAITLTLEDSFTGAPIDLSAVGTTAMFHFSGGDPRVLKASIPLTIGADAALGVCTLNWPVGALDTPGAFVGEVQVTTAAGLKITTPTLLRFRVRKELG